MIELLIESSLRTLMLAAIVGVLLAAFRVRNPALLHMGWTGVLVAMLAMPLLVRTLPPIEIPILEATWVSAAPFEQLPTAVDVGPVLSVRASPVEPGMPLPGLEWMYLAIALLLGTRLAIGYGLGIRLVRSAESIGRNELTGQKANVRYLYTERVAVPMTFGWRRPAVLLPAGFRSWAPRKLTAVLDHEHAHVTRWDFATAFLASLARTAYWLNPFGWWLEWRLRTLAERAADDRAARSDPKTYAEALLGIAGEAGPRRVHSLAMGEKRGLTARINRLMDPRYKPMSKPKPVYVLAALLIGIALVGVLSTIEITEAELPPLAFEDLPPFIMTPPPPPDFPPPAAEPPVPPVPPLETGPSPEPGPSPVPPPPPEPVQSRLPVGFESEAAEYVMREQARAVEVQEVIRVVRRRAEELNRRGEQDRSNPIDPNGEPVIVSPRIAGTRSMPECTSSARQNRIDETLVFDAVVTRDGSVEVQGIVNDGNIPQDMVEAAASTVQQWDFEPGTLNGRPVDVSLNIEVNIECG